MSDAIIEKFRGMSTANISDALDRLRMPGSAFGISPLQNGQRMIGRAYTIQYVPAGSPPGTVGDYIDDVEPGQVVVLDNSGRRDCTVWGDILTAVAHARGVAGTVIHGVCRDVYRALDVRYPIYSCGRFMRTGKDRVEVSGMNVPVTLGDVRVRPGDVVIGDDDGVLVVQQEHAEKVLEVALEIAELEDHIVEEALSGTSLREARVKYGYHQLQRSGR
ncbi:MAG TPA: RraA family protein [Chloroflexota bacterium]|nr:RraA family protein [Chloroflexota bacterium]